MVSEADPEPLLIFRRVDRATVKVNIDLVLRFLSLVTEPAYESAPVGGAHGKTAAHHALAHPKGLPVSSVPRERKETVNKKRETQGCP